MWRAVLVAGLVWAGAAGAKNIDPSAVRDHQPYAKARVELLKLGLVPVPRPRGGQLEQCPSGEICRLYPEVIGCSGVGMNQCRLAFLAPDGRIAVAMASGETARSLSFDGATWANEVDTKHVRNLMVGKPEFAD